MGRQQQPHHRELKTLGIALIPVSFGVPQIGSVPTIAVVPVPH
jgi:hypothetical protein